MTLDRRRSRAPFFGAGGGTATIHLADSGTMDGAAAFAPVLRTNLLVPEEPSLDIICYATFVTVTVTDLSATLTLLVRLLLDGTVVGTKSLSVPSSTGQVTTRYEVPWSIDAILLDGVVAATTAPRGHRVQVEIASSGTLPTGEVVIEGVECEVEQVTETVVSEVA